MDLTTTRRLFQGKHQTQFLLGLSLLIFAAIGFWMVIYATVWGLGWVADSYQYIGSARGLAQQGKLAFPGSGGAPVPLTHYPPAFPFVLAIFEWIGLDAYVTLRYFHAFLFGLTIILVGLSVFRISQSLWSSLFAALLALFSAALLERHAWALSEPLFLVLTLSGFLLVDLFYRTSKRIFLIYALICLTTGWLTRYVGVTSIAALVCVLMIVRPQGWRQNWLNVGLTLLIPFVPLFLWTIRNYHIESQFLNREITFTPMGIKNWLSIIQTLAGWLLPGRFIIGREKWLVVVGSLFLLLLFGWWIFEISRKKNSVAESLRARPLIALYLLFGVLYVPIVILGKLFFDPMIGFTERMLIPTQLSVIVLIPVLLNSLAKKLYGVGKVISVLLAILLLFYYVQESSTRLEKLNKNGLGVANRRWHESESIKMLQNLEGGQIYSNSLSTMYLWRGEPGRYFTELTHKLSQEGTETSYLVVFHYLNPNERLLRLMNTFPILTDDRIATIYTNSPLGFQE